MRLTVLGGCGAWPGAGQACSGYLIEHENFRLLIDPGYATVPRLLERVGPDDLDAVFVTHGHPDHCADLNPLLRARALRNGDLPPPLPVFAPPGALDAVLALDRPGMLSDALRLHEFDIGTTLEIGPFRADTRLLPHWLPNAGVRLTAGDRALVYTGDCGPSPELVALARECDVLLAEATYEDTVPDDSRGKLSSADDVGRQAAAANVGQLLLTHRPPGGDDSAAVAAASDVFSGEVRVADAGLVVD